jgi:cellulose synthase/poly-beta-1,6-N-acetylglucosamine synthase-like glycosyltransferase
MIEITFRTSLLLAVSLCIIIVLIFFLLCYNSWNQGRTQKRYEKMKYYVVHVLPSIKDKKRDRFIDRNKVLFLDVFIEIKQNLSSDRRVIEIATNYVKNYGFDRKYIRNLNGWKKLTRIEAASYLGNISTEKSRIALKKALTHEKNRIVNTYLINALVNLQEVSAIPIIIESLIDSPLWYQDRICRLLCEFQRDLYEYLPAIIESDKPEHVRLVLCFASDYPADNLKSYLLEHTLALDDEVVQQSLDALLKQYPTELMRKEFLENADPRIQEVALSSLTQVPTIDNLELLVDLVECSHPMGDTITYSISTILRKKPEYIEVIVNRLQKSTNLRARKIFANILSSRIEYFILKLMSRENEEARSILEEIIASGKISNVIGFLNNNKSKELENGLLSIIRKVCEKDDSSKDEFCIYLDERILEKIGWTQIIVPKKRRVEEMEKDKIAFLYLLLPLIILFFPALYIWNHFGELALLTPVDHIKIFTGDFIAQFTFYIIGANLVYIILLLISVIEVANQSKFWKVKSLSFLFKKGILPSISILAPAYGEEATIIESMNSLLGLVYPDYQLVVINDGSPDNTLKTVVDYFKLEKVDQVIDLKLKTQPIRGIYKSSSYPNLVVVDKANGGKADALNVGINVASNDYICCIDSDSLLEPAALQKIASRSLDYEEETVATGGNILPINGCSVERGSITATRIPKNRVALFQTIEYLRAFMAGRLGWTSLNSLLIISGAFGLFKRERMFEIGGYLTSSERHKKDTVGEDMELVVRLSRNMREKKIPYRIQHTYNANCWTEVPEDFSILNKQRDRWHRGLIDIIFFHRKLLFNPAYGSLGLVSFPYFFIFEVVGPFFELFGYFAIISQIIFGMIDYPIALLIFSANILMGIIISLMGLLISRWHERTNYFSFREVLVLMFYAFLENFGVRQVISMWRIGGYINSMKKPKGWGKMVRKGFSKPT